MSGTNIISGFQITNNLNITDGNLVLQTNGSNVNGPSLDLTGTMLIGNVTETTSNNSKLKVSNQDLATIELISKQQPSDSTSTTTSIKNDQGILKFNVENSTRNVKYIFDVSDNLGVGMISNIEGGNERIGFVLGTTEIININNGVGSNGKINMENYDNPHLFYNYHDLSENRFLGFAGTNIQFLTANETDLSLNELNPRMIINTSGNIGINTLNPGVSLNVNDNDGIKLPTGTTAQRPTTSSTNLSDISGIIRFNTDLQKCEVYQNTWVPLGQTTSLDGTTRIESTNTEGIELKINDITRVKLHDSSSRIDLSGNVVVQNANDDGIIFTVDGSSNFIGNVGIGTNNPAGNLEIKKYLELSSLSSNPIESQLILSSNSQRCYIGSYYTSGVGSKVAISSSDFFGGIDHPQYLLLNPNGGNVGIGTDSPILNLDVSGTRMGRCIPTGDSHSEAHRNSFKIGRFDGNNAENFIGLELKVDTATNMGFGSADNQSTIIFKTWGNSNGNEKECMRINSDGNVGIGTDSPQVSQAGLDNGIHINTSNASYGAKAGILLSNNASNYDSIKAGIFSSRGTSDANAGLYFNIQTRTGSGTANENFNNFQAYNRMVIRHDGNVGIGTTSPRKELEIHGDVMLFSENDGGENKIYFNHSNTTNQYQKVAIISDAVGSNQYGRAHLHFCLNKAANSTNVSLSDTKLMLNGLTGNVGIGVTDPKINLEVKGTGGLLVSNGNWTYTGGNNPVGAIFFTNNQRNYPMGCVSGLDYRPTSNGQFLGGLAFYTFHDGYTYDDISHYSGSNGLLERMRIDMNGNVGIGRSPGHKLDVNGNIRVGVGGGGENAIFFKGNTGDTSDSMCVIENRIYGGTEQSELLLFKGNDDSNGSGPDRIRLRAAEILLDTYSSATDSRDTENIRLKIDEDGNTICGKINLAYNNEINCTYSSGNTLYLNYNSGNVNLANHGGSTYCGGTISTTGYNVRGSGWVYWSSHGNKGWYMQDSTWIRTLSNASIYAGSGTIATTGEIGIGTSGPNYPLHVNKTYQRDAGSFTFYSGNGYHGGGAGGTVDISIFASGRINASQFNARSDRRIKENIIEVPDNLSLQTLRDINCCYYNYRDRIIKGNEKTIGFIAQQVREQMPMAVSLVKDVIPNEMRIIENPVWTTITDGSGNNKFKLTITDLEDVSGNTKYKFYMSNKESHEDEEMIECYSLENEPNSFIFDEKYNYVYLYGKEVDDFHFLQKSMLFALNFSATQEIDRIQQQEKTKLNQANAKIADLENKNNALTSKIADLENQMYEIKQLLAAANN